MELKKILIFILLGMSFFFGLTSKAVIVDFQTPIYMGGNDLCTQGKEEYLASEFGHFLNVPLKHENKANSKESIAIYYWTREPFNPQLPTLVYVNGGPGASAHEISFLGMTGFNIVFFDQRGVACSKAPTEALQKQKSIYSIEYIAQDLDLIRKDLKIQKWSVYGHSFGSTIATVYASFFPQSTKALILEGTIFEGNSTVWLPAHRLKMMQKYFDSLTSQMQEYVLLKSKEEDQEAFFENSLRSFMYGNEFHKSFYDYLKYMFDYDLKSSPEIYHFGVKNFYRSDFLQNSTTWGMMACQYLSALDPMTTLKFVFKNRQLVPVADAEQFTYRKKQCSEAGVHSLSESKHYQAINYPVQVPTTYFQGANDGATAFPQPSNHYKNVAKGSRQILIMPQGGHSPQLSLLAVSDFDGKKLTEKDKSLAKAQAVLLKKAALGQKIEPADLIEFNSISPLAWKLHNKKF